MKKGRIWTRFLAVVLAAVMLLTNQGIVMAADMTAETQAQEAAAEESKNETQGDGEAADSDPASQKDGAGEQSAVSGSGQSTQAGAEQAGASQPAGEQAGQQTAPAQSQQSTQPGTPAQQPAAETTPQELTLADKETGVQVTGMDNVLPEGAALQVDEKKEGEDADYPAQAKEDIAAKLEQEENLSLKDIAFYDISLGGGQPADKVEVKLPVPDDWTGELDAWYVDEEGNITNIDREAEDTEGYYTFLTDHFSLYAVSVSEPKEEEPADKEEETRPAEEKGSQNAAEPAPQNVESKDADEDTDHMTFEEAAEFHYGENGTTQTASASIMNQGSSEVKTGETISFLIDYKLAAAATYNYGEYSQPLFDTYDDTKIILHLPENLRVVEGAEGTLQNVADVITPEEAGITENDYVLVLNDSIMAGSDTVGSFIVNIEIEGNGRTEKGHVYDLANILEIQTSFTVKDRTDPEHITDGKKYTKSISEPTGLENLTATTEDKWIVEKAPSQDPDPYVISQDKTEVTVRFDLKIGLTQDGTTIVSQAETYGRPGRVPFADENNMITLTETPEVLGRNGEEIKAKSITVTPQFGGGHPITFNPSGGSMQIPVDTCKGKTIGLNVDDAAPYYSQYLVEIVYPYEEFIAQYYDENQEKLRVDNKASIQYVLKTYGGGLTETSTSDTFQMVGEVTEPAGLTLGKEIVGWNDENREMPYISINFEKEDPVSGSVTYKITDTEGSPATLYTKVDGKYQKLTDANGKVTYNPANDTENVTGTVTVYMDPGHYTVTEETLPVNTEKISSGEHNANPKELDITAGETETAVFYNKETLGGIGITKYGQREGNTAVLGGAVFGLYSDEKCTAKIAEVTTGSDGKASFDRLPYNTYYVKEISAPEGYIKDDKVTSCTISKDNPTAQIESTNKYNLAPVSMQKQYLNVNDDNTYDDVDQTNYDQFDNCFEVQKKGADGSWTAVAVGTGGATKLSLGQDGKLNLTLSVYEEDGTTPITYRIVEYLSEGWHATGETTTEDGKRVVYTEAFTLEKNLGNAETDPYVVPVLKNDQYGSIALTKQFYQASASGMVPSTDQDLTASFDLYYVEDNGKPVKFNDAAYTVAAGKTITISDLPRTGEDEVSRDYYLVETTSEEGYEASDTVTGTNDGEWTTLEIDGKETKAFGPFNFAEEIKDTKQIELEQSATISNVEQKVPVVVKKVNSYTKEFVPGAEYTIYEYDGNTKGAAVVTNVEITTAAGALSKLDPGHKYLIEETLTPEGYKNVTGKDELVVDLTRITKVEIGQATIVSTIENQPDPTLTVTKQRDNAAGNNTTLNNVTFEVYARDEKENTFIRVNGYDKQPLTITSGTPLRLPAGTYYLKEVVPENNPNGILDPSAHPELYKTEDGIKTEDGFFFGPVNVVQQENAQTYGPVVNYSNKGNVRVTKYRMTTEGKKEVLAGARIGIYKGETLVKEVTSVADTGFADFTDLPIYNEKGEKITYTVKEISAPQGYTASDETLSVRLTPGGTVTTATDGSSLELINQPETSLQVTKTYYNMWEHAFTNKEYELPGTVIALYKKNTEGNYDFVDTETTNGEGNVFFEGLTQKDEYVAIEVRVPDGEAYQYLEPEEKGREYLDPDYQPDTDLPPTISAGNLNKYYYVTKESNTSNTPKGAQQRDMVNVENWAQLQIKKFVLEDGTDGTIVGAERLINNAQFTLYMQVVDPETQALAFDLTVNPESYTEIGSYSSGTLYDTDGNRMDGWFGTDVLKSADNVVYWLVETNAGIGASIRGENVVTLIKREDTNYSNNTSYVLDGETVHPNEVMDYKDNQVTKEDFENHPEYEGGSAMFSTVRIAKWAGTRKETGEKIYNYTPLGNASFDLYLADSDGNLYTRLDTMTTGLDNNIGGAQEGGLNAWASSRAFSWKELTEEYSKSMSEELYQDIFSTDENGNGYVRVAVVESDAPTGYMMEKNTYYMYMFFKNGGEKQTTEIFNDAYYVKGDHESADDKDVPLAEEQEGITWAMYPTEEAEGQYQPVSDTQAPANDQSGSRYRLVNWPIDTWAVTVQKYGYQVQDDNLKKNSEELDKYYASGVHTDRVPLKVTMLLETYENGAWRPYAYTSSHADGRFTTDDSGFFAFPEGLPMGSYRITEVTPAPGYENIYDGSTITGGADRQDKAAYYFQVQADNVNITMYNPKKLYLSVMKTDMEENALEGTGFTLTEQGSSGSMTARTGKDGRAEFENVGTGTYKLTESATDGYVGSYFSEYFKETYSGAAYNNNGGKGNLNDLVNGGGIFLGYDTSLKAGESGTSVQVTKVTDIANYGIKTEEGMVLTVRNPEKVSFQIQKKDADTKEALKGAQFKVEYQPFAKVRGEIVATSTEGWQLKETVTTQGDEGLATIVGEPGIYRITETKAPEGYDITSKEPQYVAMTGGLAITSVKVDEKGVELNKEQPLEFVDDHQVSLKVTKTIRPGDLKVSGDHAFTFTLYDENKSELKDLTITTTNGERKDGTFTGLSQGKTYYLKETGVKAGFAFIGMIDSEGKAMTPDDNGFYQITMPTEPKDVSVTVENTYLYAQVSIRKVDGENGGYLDDAHFKVVRVTGSGEEEVSVNIEAKGDGLYTAVLPLTGTAEETFRFYETQAPPDYLLDTDHYIEVTVGPGQLLGEPGWEDDKYTSADRETNNQAMLQDRLFPNYRGAYVDLVKYDNVHAAKDSSSEQQGATFTLYQYDEDAKAWVYAGRDTTDADGKIHFVVNGGIRYAVEETTIPNGYQGLEGIYDEKDEKAKTEDTMIGQEDRTIHLINGGEPIQAGVTYTYEAYDIPFLDLEIQKENALDPSKRLTAVADVYEVPEGTVLDSDKAVETFLAGSHGKLLNDVDIDQPGESGGRVYSYSDDERLDNAIVAGKTYLVVETSAGTSQIRENSKVEWYDVIEVQEGSRNAQTAILKNIEGTAPLSLQKTADKTSFKSLFTEGATVQYTITPKVDTNTYPLTDFTVRDNGLAAFSGGQRLPDTDIYLKGNYSLTQVTVGQASHETADLAEGIDGPICATVTFYGADGESVYTSEPMDVSAGPKEAMLPEGSGKAAKISVSYECTQFKEATGYDLGTMFRPGSIQVTAVIDQQTGSEDEQIIDRIMNTADTTLHYLEWSGAGAKAETPKEVIRTATEDIHFGEQEAARVSVSKTADHKTVNLRQPVEYSISITNDTSAKEAMQEPFLVDYLPQGTSWQTYGDKPEEAVILEAGTADITFSHARSETKNGETAVFVFLNGDLDPGETVTVKLKVMTEDAAAQYGNSMNNYVLVGSDMAGARTEENPQGASFKNATDNWAQSVDDVTTTMDDTRRETLKLLLAEQASYGYVSARTSVNWAGSSDLVTVKSAYGDRNADTGYSTDILSTVENGGTMHYRLSIANSSELFTTTEFSLIDILPAVGDFTSGNVARDSQWALNFGEVTGVYVSKAKEDGTTENTSVSKDDYRVYYYTGNLEGSSSYQSLYNSVTQLGYDDIGNLPQGWTSNLPSDKNTIRAFAVALNNSEQVQLGKNDMLAVEYTAVVNGGKEWDVPTLNENSWENAVNSFACTYSRFQTGDTTPHPVNEVIGSNQVSNTIMPEVVGVGGHIWIDKNDDGIWQPDESISNFQGNYLIGQMLDEIEVRLFTYLGTNSSSSASTAPYDQKSEGWKTEANYKFLELDPAMLKENVSEEQAYPGGILDPSQLKGTEPSTYTLNVTIPNEVIGKYKVTSVGTTSGISRDPRTIAQDHPEETKDNNFTQQGSAAVSERFYLWATDPKDSDNTKDIGLVPYRTLEIHKTAADDPTTRVEGAQFTVYGPFAEDYTVTEADLIENNKVFTGTTDANGNLTVGKDLLWYANYVIVEDSTAAGYELDGAAATATNGTNIETIRLGQKPAWLLKRPEDNKRTAVDTMNITNDRTEVKATLEAEKEYLKNDIKQELEGNEFTFNLWSSLQDITDGKEPLMTAKNTANGSVTFGGIDALTYERPGTHYYYITEQQKDSNPSQGVTYDEAIYRATVYVTWTEGEGLKTSVAYEEQTDIDIWETVISAKFTNEYDAKGTWAPEVYKTLTGRDMKDDESFTFEVVENIGGTEQVVAKGTASGGKNGQPVKAVFDDPIPYDLDDVGVEHIYTIREQKAGQTENGLTYSGAEYKVTVTVRDNGDGTLHADAVYPDQEESVNFENTYKPDPIYYTPVVTKTVTGNALPADQIFEFTLTKGIFTPDDGAQMPTDTQAQITVKKGATNGTVTDNFGQITFKKAGTYTFTIAEEKPTQAGFEDYDKSQWTLTVVVSDDGEGNLTQESVVYTKAAVNDGTEAAFTNEYDPADAMVRLQAAKIMTSDLAEELPHDMTFTFEQSYNGTKPDSVLMPQADNQVQVTMERLDQKEVTPEFGEITFTAAGEYTFVIEELIPAEADREPGVNYDNRVWYADVTVKDEGGQLKASDPVYYLSTSTLADPSEPVFANKYQTEKTDFTPGISKTLTGDPIPDTKTFTFELTADAGNDKDGFQILDRNDPDKTVTTGTATVTYSAGQSGTKLTNFNDIRFSKAGVYSFTIKEINDTANGYQYDTKGQGPWTLKVEIEDDGGALDINSVSYVDKTGNKIDTPNARAAFTNSYAVTDTTYIPKVTKKMTGDPRPGDAAFAFTIEQGTSNPTGGAVLDKDTEASVTIGKNVNEATVPESDTPTADENAFGPITFSQEGTYTFTIREKDPDKPGYEDYDNEPWTLTVVVEDENSKLKVVSHTYTRGTDQNETAGVFTNSYETKDSAPFTPEVKKTVTGEKRPEGSQTFDFTLTPPAGDGFTIAGDDRVATVTVTDNESTGTTTDPFGEITFTKAGTYKFQIAEEQGSADGYTYDTAPWLLTVVVDDKDSQLVVTSHTYTRDGDTTSTEYATVVNSYAVEPTKFTPAVKKTITGDDRPGDVTFDFELRAKEDGFDPVDGVVMPNDTKAAITLTPKETEGTDSAAGQDGFGAIRFIHAGTYEFEITETDAGKNGYGYDGSTWILKVTVEDIGGKLQVAEDGVQYVKADGTGANADAAAFVNSYSTTEAHYDPRVEKALTGDPTPVDKTFTFTLVRNEAAEEEGTPADGAVIGNGQTTVTGAGSGSFGDITFDKAGTYHFTIAEVPGSDAGYEYDPQAWDLEVVVEDRASTLTIVSHTYTKTDADGKEVTSDEEATFTNDYQVEPTGYTPTVTKAVTGDVPEGKDAKFRFALTAREDNPEGAVLPKKTEVSIQGSGEADFGEIEFEQAGTYRFDITEINDQLPGYQYDGSVWTLTVVVKDTEHILGVDIVSYTRQDETTADTAAFENHYQPDEAAYAPKVTKHINGDKTPSNATFTFTMQALADNPKGAAVEGTTAAVEGAGQTAFAPITFTKAGTYRFDIREADGHEAGYTYDEHVWRLTVEVADADGVLTIAEVKYEKVGTFMSSDKAAEFINEYKAAVAAGGNVKTGDPSDLPGALAGLSVSALFILILMYYKKRERKQK